MKSLSYYGINWNLADDHIRDRSKRRPAAQRYLETIERCQEPDRHRLDPPVGQVARVPVYAQSKGGPAGERAEAHALHPAGHHVPACKPVGLAGSHSYSVALRNRAAARRARIRG